MHRIIALMIFLVPCTATWADVLTFENDYPGFVDAAGPLSMIDFETMPDGQPTEVSVELTEDFNFDGQGVHFSAPIPYPFFAGNPWDGFGLSVEGNGDNTWIIAELLTPVQVVGGFFPGVTELCAFDASGAEVGCVQFNGAGDNFFVGIVSDVPIVSATFNDGSDHEAINAFVFSPVPDPGTLMPLMAGAAMALRRKRHVVS